jgi:hypothetical protein
VIDMPKLKSVAGPFNQQHLEMRQDVLCYSSEIFDQPMDIVGLVVLRLYAASSAKDTDFVAKLIDVFPMLVCDGCRRARFRHGFTGIATLGPWEPLPLPLTGTSWPPKPIKATPKAKRILPGWTPPLRLARATNSGSPLAPLAVCLPPARNGSVRNLPSGTSNPVTGLHEHAHLDLAAGTSGGNASQMDWLLERSGF